MHPHRVTCKVVDLINILGWDEADEIVVEIGGTATSGIHQTEGVNPKWSMQFGETKYNKDAFIVIKNADRNPVVSSKKPDEVQPDD